MNNQARSCELKCKYNIQGICHAYGECIAKDLFIEELEKIKAEMAIKTQENLDAYKDCLEIVRNHISELKGENND